MVEGFKSKCSLQGSNRQIDRGTLLVDFGTTYDFLLVNDPTSEPTFQGGVNLSWINLTMTRLVHRRLRIEDSEVNKEIKLSDHMKLKLLDVTNQTNSNNKKYNVTKLNWLRLKPEFGEALSNISK